MPLSEPWVPFRYHIRQLWNLIQGQEWKYFRHLIPIEVQAIHLHLELLAFQDDSIFQDPFAVLRFDLTAKINERPGESTFIERIELKKLVGLASFMTSQFISNKCPSRSNRHRITT